MLLHLNWSFIADRSELNERIVLLFAMDCGIYWVTFKSILLEYREFLSVKFPLPSRKPNFTHKTLCKTIPRSHVKIKLKTAQQIQANQSLITIMIHKVSLFRQL